MPRKPKAPPSIALSTEEPSPEAQATADKFQRLLAERLDDDLQLTRRDAQGEAACLGYLQHIETLAPGWLDMDVSLDAKDLADAISKAFKAGFTAGVYRYLAPLPEKEDDVLP